LTPELRGKRGSDKAAERVMTFLDDNQIQTMQELIKHVKGIYSTSQRRLSFALVFILTG
jgi:hypothetical protein